MISMLILLIAIALIFASVVFVFNKLQSKIFIPTGIEFLLLGVLIGKFFSNWFSSTFNIDYPIILSNAIQTDLKIILMILLGIVGFVYGLDFQFSSIRSCSKDSYLYVLVEFLLSFFITGGLTFILLFNFLYDGENFSEILTFAYLTGIIGVMSSKFIINKISDKFNISGSHIFHIKQSVFLNLNLSIALYGLVYGIAQISSLNHINIISYKWVFIGIGLIILLGILFYLFIGNNKEETKLLIAVVGMISLTTGISISLNFSVLYMNFLLGVIIINTSKVGLTLRQALAKSANVLSFLIFFFAGYYWIPSAMNSFFIGAILFLSLRFVVKIFSGKVFNIISLNTLNFSDWMGKAFLPIEIAAAAIILDYINSFVSELNPLLMSIVFSAIIFWSILGFNSVKKFLIDTNELKEAKQ